MESVHEPKVWGVFVGERGSELAAFNSQTGPFPPKPGTEGFVAIGWPAVGDMRMYKDRYNDFSKNFSLVYGNSNNRVLNTQANMVWNFAYTIQEGDYVISPSSHNGVIMIGVFIGDYLSEFDDWTSVAPHKNRNDLTHIRKVRWISVIKKGDDRFAELNRIGQLTVSTLSITKDRLLSLIDKRGE
jgi:restriction system protein